MSRLRRLLSALSDQLSAHWRTMSVRQSLREPTCLRSGGHGGIALVGFGLVISTEYRVSSIEPLTLRNDPSIELAGV